MKTTTTSNRIAGITCWIAATFATAAFATSHSHEREPSRAQQAIVVDQGSQPSGVALTQRDEMIWKYTARCALRADQVLEAPAGSDGKPVVFKGELGLAPEWQQGTCGAACQEKVSSCLYAFMNRTGKHVKISMLSAAPSLAEKMKADDVDLVYPRQEGAFFGNLFANQAFVCRGRDTDKAAQVKRFCAVDPASCGDIAPFVDAGRCEDACEMSCSRLRDGTRRCLAVRCQDPTGRLWEQPITIYMRDQIEAGNADDIVGARSVEQELDDLHDGSAVTFRAVDFGRGRGGVHAFAARLASGASGGRVEVWLDGRRRLGSLPIVSTGGVARDQGARIDARGVSGPHDVVLRFAGLRASVHLATISFR